MVVSISTVFTIVGIIFVIVIIVTSSIINVVTMVITTTHISIVVIIIIRITINDIIVRAIITSSTVSLHYDARMLPEAHGGYALVPATDDLDGLGLRV